MSEGANESECMTLGSAARTFGVCVRTVRREIARGNLRAFRVGKRIRISLSELKRYQLARTLGEQQA